MSRERQAIRNIGIIAHIDAGKTTTTERILFYSGAQHNMGDVDDGNTTTDSDLEESDRGITIYSAAVTCEWNDHTINIIDTPGHVDFTAEVERSLRVLDGGVVVFSAVEGVEAQSETVWRQADKYRVPRICFINKMDRIGADFERTITAIEERLHAQPVVLVIPMGAGSLPDPNALCGIIDLIEMRSLTFDEESRGKVFKEGEIPEEFMEEAILWRSKLLESIALLDNEAMEMYLETEDIPKEHLYKLLRLATVQGQIQPVLSGSSLDYIGVQPLLDAVVRYLPSPLDRPAVEGKHPSSEKPEVRQGLEEEPFCGLVFKIQSDDHGDLCFMRVYSGKLKGNSRLLNPRTGKKEFLTHLYHIQADRRTKVEAEFVVAGDIIGVVGPKETYTGDTICDPKSPIVLENITFPDTVISVAIEPETSSDRKKLTDALKRMEKQDPTFNWRVSEDTGQTIVSGMGELHLEVIEKRIQREFKLNIRVHKPRVSYRETIRKMVEKEAEFSQKTKDDSQYASVTIRVEPFEKTDSVEVVNQIESDVLSYAWKTSLTQTVKEVVEGGGSVGYPLMKVKLTLLDVKTREGETTEVALQAAASRAVREALDEAGCVLLEPVMALEVTTPEEFLGNIQSDLNSRRALILNSEPLGHYRLLNAEAALSRLFGYSTQIRSLSQGRASYSMEPLKYAEAPPEVLNDMMF